MIFFFLFLFPLSFFLGASDTQRTNCCVGESLWSPTWNGTFSSSAPLLFHKPLSSSFFLSFFSSPFIFHFFFFPPPFVYIPPLSSSLWLCTRPQLVVCRLLFKFHLPPNRILSLFFPASRRERFFSSSFNLSMTGRMESRLCSCVEKISINSQPQTLTLFVLFVLAAAAATATAFQICRRPARAPAPPNDIIPSPHTQMWWQTGAIHRRLVPYTSIINTHTNICKTPARNSNASHRASLSKQQQQQHILKALSLLVATAESFFFFFFSPISYSFILLWEKKSHV